VEEGGMKIKVISLWNPWAFAMWAGLKQYETRSEKFVAMSGLRNYSGWLGIHAAKMFWLKAIDRSMEGAPIEERKAFAMEMILRLDDAPIDKGDHGVLGGICRFSGIYQTQQIEPKLSEMERFFGNYAPGRRAIFCPGMVRLPAPIPMRGYQRAWNWEVTPEVELLLKAQDGFIRMSPNIDPEVRK
jgi:hypothetical protein